MKRKKERRDVWRARKKRNGRLSNVPSSLKNLNKSRSRTALNIISPRSTNYPPTFFIPTHTHKERERKN